MENLLAVLIQLFFELFGEFLLALLLELSLESMGRSLGWLGLVILGAISGLATSLLMPARLLTVGAFSGLSMILAPLATGLVLGALGHWQRGRFQKTTRLATFRGGACFAFAMAAVRWALAGRV